MTTNTAEFRLERIPAAVAEIRTSPIIGLGAASFGQRHALVGNVAGIPDYIAILALSVVYETGLLGAGALAVGFLLAFLLLFRASRRSAGEAAAFSAALVSLLVAYQVTSAIFASFIWVILGAALAFAVRPDESAIPSQS
jgi:O-antigen ligase